VWCVRHSVAADLPAPHPPEFRRVSLGHETLLARTRYLLAARAPRRGISVGIVAETDQRSRVLACSVLAVSDLFPNLNVLRAALPVTAAGRDAHELVTAAQTAASLDEVDVIFDRVVTGWLRAESGYV
jgi:hypothetical protein